jgi:molecular chaperone HtpG
VIIKYVIVAYEHGWTENFQRLMNVQALKDTSMTIYMKQKKTLEINSAHPAVTKIVEQLETNSEDKSTKNDSFIARCSTSSSSFSLENPAAFSSQINRMVSVALDVAAQFK